MKYLEKSFSVPVFGGKMTELEYKFRVGALTEKEYKRKLVELKNAKCKSKTAKSNGDCGARS